MHCRVELAVRDPYGDHNDAVSIDLLLAPDLLTPAEKARASRAERATAQMRAVWKLQGAMSSEHAQMLSPACVEAQCVFTAGTSADAHEAARLLKAYVSHQLARRKWTGDKISSLSFTLELVAVHACMQLQRTAGGRGLGMKAVMEHALGALAQMQHMDVSFTTYYAQPKHFSLPCVADPCNPRSDVLRRVKTKSPRALDTLQAIADEGLQRLRSKSNVQGLFEG